VIDVDGVMTKDLAIAIYGNNMKREHWVVTDAYLDAVNVSVFSVHLARQLILRKAKLKEKMKKTSTKL
jgi:isocitrate dehydrogenase